jgi:glycine dehydrogenase
LQPAFSGSTLGGIMTPDKTASSARPTASATDALAPGDLFERRHIGPSPADQKAMLATLGFASLDALADAVVPEGIRLRRPLALAGLPTDRALGEQEALARIRGYANENQVFRSLIGLGYYDAITPGVILRNVLENPGWYTQYTPYQGEIAQGRLEALLNFQTMVADLTGLPLAGASLLDEGTAAGEAMAMCFSTAGGAGGPKTRFLIAKDAHPQTIAVVRTRGGSLGATIEEFDPAQTSVDADVCGVLVQYPTTDGRIVDYSALVQKAHAAGALVVFATDLLALALLKPPGELGADIAVGSAQRFGVPMGFGGPHAGFISTNADHIRRLPGRIIGVSRDAQGRTAYRMAIGTREQHIRREKATSNICTAQALLAIMAGFYGIYHGPEGVRRIAERTHRAALLLARGLEKLGHQVLTPAPFFDTLRVRPKGTTAADVLRLAAAQKINLRDFGDGTLGLSTDECTDSALVCAVLDAFQGGKSCGLDFDALLGAPETQPLGSFTRTSAYLTHPVFHAYHSETEMLRYITKLQGRDLSLAQSMIALGSCTMKLNATVEMIPVTWPEFGKLHPFAPADQWRGYAKLFGELESWLAEITGFSAVSLQPNAGSQGEYAGMLVIRAYHESRGDVHRDVCLIPTSAHGTNPATAVTAGMRVITVACDDHGNVRVDDLREKATTHARELAALMITYPSTHGVFEESIAEICSIVHANGGQVYMDGANMNAQVGLCRPGDIGADVCHLNLHKTFAIPHGGGGPGMAPIGMAAHLAPFLPSHPVTRPLNAGAQGISPVSAAPYGSASILPISWLYVALMGPLGLRHATECAILNANYMAKRLGAQFPVLYTGKGGLCAHEFILDCRQFKKGGTEIDDIAKRLMDYGFHAPTMSFPVPGTLMIEPTESESKEELDRFCDALLSIREEIRDVEEGRAHKTDNVLKNSPHTLQVLIGDAWTHPYSREQAAYPAKWLRDTKFWPFVGRIDNPYGDRNLMCSCPPVEAG